MSLSDGELMQIADEQINWIAEKFEGSREAGRLALLSVLIGVRDGLLAAAGPPTAIRELRAKIQALRDESAGKGWVSSEVCVYDKILALVEARTPVKETT